MKIKLIIVLSLLVLAGCIEKKVESIEIHNKQHVTYLNDYGWTAERFASETKYEAGTLRSYKEHVDNIQTHGLVDLTPFLDEKVVETGYILQEKTDNYNQIVGYILESGNEIIGGYLEFNKEVEQSNGTIRIDLGETTPMFNSKGRRPLETKKVSVSSQPTLRMEETYV